MFHINHCFIIFKGKAFLKSLLKFRGKDVENITLHWKITNMSIYVPCSSGGSGGQNCNKVQKGKDILLTGTFL